jgi:hypothetical protein
VTVSPLDVVEQLDEREDVGPRLVAREP